jgi:predicted nucleic acid-binding protein
MKQLLDTNILVYRIDPNEPVKRAIATELVYRGALDNQLVLSHQTLMEFMAAAIKPRKALSNQALMTVEDACLEVEFLMRQFPVLYPDVDTLELAMTGMTRYCLSWWDAHLWAYAAVHGIPEILSEDFQHGRHYGAVRVLNPFLAAEDAVHELPPMYEVSGR